MATRIRSWRSSGFIEARRYSSPQANSRMKAISVSANGLVKRIGFTFYTGWDGLISEVIDISATAPPSSVLAGRYAAEMRECVVQAGRHILAESRFVMLKIYTAHGPAPEAWRTGSDSFEGSPVWLDLIEPTDDERREAETFLGVWLPTREQTSAIELSSRLMSTETVVRVNIPSFVRTEDVTGPSTPLGFVLTPSVLATVRYADSLSFDHVSATFARAEGPGSSTDVFGDLVESIVDVGADRIESIATQLSKLSQAVFSEEKNQREDCCAPRCSRWARCNGKTTRSAPRLLGVSRVVTYLCDVSPSWTGKKLQSRLKVVHADIISLNEFDQQLGERLQFLLDAVLGFINNDQNDIMRVLTIVSVATVPPMILAGIWGMNFKSIPEYNWAHGYAFALTMIILSMAIPLLIFRMKKWL